MTLLRREILKAGGGIIAALTFPPLPVRAGEVIEIAMAGTEDGADVWFDPIGLRVRPGQTVRFVNRDSGNSHSATAYHPAYDRPRRIPGDAVPWDSGYLLPGESFSVSLEASGIYDYYCRPHEMAGMVGRIIVGEPDMDKWLAAGQADHDIPQAALLAFPPVERIMTGGAVRRHKTTGR